MVDCVQVLIQRDKVFLNEIGKIPLIFSLSLQRFDMLLCFDFLHLYLHYIKDTTDLLWCSCVSLQRMQTYAFVCD